MLGVGNGTADADRPELREYEEYADKCDSGHGVVERSVGAGPKHA